jgi:hypothetical protein
MESKNVLYSTPSFGARIVIPEHVEVAPDAVQPGVVINVGVGENRSVDHGVVVAYRFDVLQKLIRWIGGVPAAINQNVSAFEDPVTVDAVVMRLNPDRITLSDIHEMNAQDRICRYRDGSRNRSRRGCGLEILLGCPTVPPVHELNLTPVGLGTDDGHPGSGTDTRDRIRVYIGF